MPPRSRATGRTACPRCGRRDVPTYPDGRMATHRVPTGLPPRPNCRASGRRPENALVDGDLRTAPAGGFLPLPAAPGLP